MWRSVDCLAAGDDLFVNSCTLEHRAAEGVLSLSITGKPSVVVGSFAEFTCSAPSVYMGLIAALVSAVVIDSTAGGGPPAGCGCGCGSDDVG